MTAYALSEGKTLVTHSGTAFALSRDCFSKEYGAIRSANSAVRINRMIMIPPVSAARLRTRRSMASCHRLRLLPGTFPGIGLSAAEEGVVVCAVISFSQL